MRTYVLHYLGVGSRIAESGIAGSHGNSMFNFLKNCHTAFQSSNIWSFPFLHIFNNVSYCPSCCLWSSQWRWSSISAVLVCISLTTKAVELLFMCSLVICMCSLEDIHIWEMYSRIFWYLIKNPILIGLSFLKSVLFICFYREGKQGWKEGREILMCKRKSIIQACALPGNRTRDLLVCGMVSSPLNHTSQV